MFSLICAWLTGWVNNREAGGLKRHRAHYDVIAMTSCDLCSCYLRRPLPWMSEISNVITSWHWKTFYITSHLNDGLVMWTFDDFFVVDPNKLFNSRRCSRRIILMWSHFNESTTTRIVLITITNQQFLAHFKVRKLDALVYIKVILCAHILLNHMCWFNGLPIHLNGAKTVQS